MVNCAGASTCKVKSETLFIVLIPTMKLKFLNVHIGEKNILSFLASGRTMIAPRFFGL